MIPESLAHYRILGYLGAGGMEKSTAPKTRS